MLTQPYLADLPTHSPCPNSLLIHTLTFPYLSQSRVRIPQQLLKVRLEPRPRFRRRLQRITQSAVVVVSRRRRVRSAITLAAGLDPDERVLERVARVGREGHAETRADQVAPVAPFVLGRGLDAVAGCHVS